MRVATILALAILASPAAADLDPYKGSSGLIFPSLPEPYWGVYTPWMPAPKIGVEGGQANPEFRLAERDGWDNDRAPTRGDTYSERHGSGVAISLPSGEISLREIIQGLRQTFSNTDGEPAGGCTSCNNGGRGGGLTDGPNGMRAGGV